MSKQLINQYYNELERLIQYGGSRNETSIRGAFQYLLNQYCQTKDFLLVPELEYQTKKGKKVAPDGTVKDALRLDWGFWESKDEYDNLDEEIEKKLAKGYPDDNILFEDSQTAVLIQGGEEMMRVSMQKLEDLDKILIRFLEYVRPEVANFREAIAKFQEDLPTILKTLRDLIKTQDKNNQQFKLARDEFLAICQESINPEISRDDVREMIIQHILSEDIFTNIFNDSQFHRENNIARQLQRVLDTFFTGTLRRNTLSSIESYYAVIRKEAAAIANHHEKQKFLKVIYENFYKSYNPEAADRLGIVYTPNEIVRFMVESVDYLLEKHFNKSLGDSGVQILDPATGTGTFITELIEYLPKQYLPQKYREEIHCNEVAILPYYIANLNIEYAYQQKMGEYEEFKNICFLDTLEHTTFGGKQLSLFVTAENAQRIKRQNDLDISVIIGNPPYNAKQENFNQQNANRVYEAIDKRIKETYIKEGTAQNQIVLYDMYVRFIRWASDRLGKNGVLAFITNSSFLDARTFDGFRKVLGKEFSAIYLLDLGGNVRAISGINGVFIGEKHTIFGRSAMIGIAILFLVKDDSEKASTSKIYYCHPFDIHELRDNKLKYLAQTKFSQIPFERIAPDKNHNWINLTDNDYDELLPLIDKEVKRGKSETAVFKLFSNGLETGRDLWLYDFSETELNKKVKFFIKDYNESLTTRNKSKAIKWNRDLERLFSSSVKIKFSSNKVTNSHFRPFTNKKYYADSSLNYLLTQNHYDMFGNNLYKKNRVIAVSGIGFTQPFHCLAVQNLTERHFVEKSQCLPLYYYEKGQRTDNITDWGLQQFQNHYQDKTISKIDIFHYTYAVLHNPAYREKYELNLKREFPRIPFYENFRQWAEWGEKLIELHLNYETIKPHQLTRIDLPQDEEKLAPKPKLKADKTQGKIIIDTVTTLEGIPEVAWEYRLGNRSALEWILDQYKEKKPKDKTIAEQFNNYRFADYKETVIDLLKRVCTVSVETMKIINEGMNK